MPKKIIPPNHRYRYLVLAIASCMSMQLYANEPSSQVAIENFQSDQSYSDSDIYSAPNLSKQLSAPNAQRMGEWLTKELEKDPQNYYESAMAWEAKAEVDTQQQKINLLSQKIEDFANNKEHHKKELLTLKRWIESLQATGRVILPKQDPRYMQVNPGIEPVLQTGDVVKVHGRPDTLTVMLDDTQGCQVIFEAGVRAKDYIDECINHLGKNFKADEAYLISPEGTVQYITLAKWNAQSQSPPNAGSWLWVPSPDKGWAREISESVAQVIAMQGIDLRLANGQNDTVIGLSNKNPETARDLPISSSDWGVVGLMQTPTARMHKQGTLVTHISDVDPYTQYNLLLQPFSWLETTVRYSNIEGVSYGPVSPDQDYKDKSIDVKLKLLEEDRWLPELAVGWRDPAGTSLFGGEYLVANKRYGDFDFSLGLGWGYLGARGNIDNPLGFIDDRFEDRVEDKKGQGGELSPKSWFTGPASFFGGVQWHTPYDPLTIKIEYDGNDYKSERFFDDDYESKDMPINLGVTWQNLDRGVALSAGYERGDTMMFGLTLQGDLTELGRKKPKAYQVKNQPKTPRAQYSSLKYRINLGTDQSETSTNTALLNAFSQASGWRATDITMNDGKVLVNVDNYSGVFVKERMQQGIEILRQALPAETTFIQIQVSRYGEPVGVFNIDPQTWTQQYLQLLPPSQRIEQPLTITAAAPSYNTLSSQVVAHSKPWQGSITFSPSLQQSIGGPDGYLFGIFADANVDYSLWQGSWIDAKAQIRVADNYDKYTYTADSKLPRVRTNIGDYMTTSRILMPSLQWNQFKSFGNNLYGLAYAGYLESMYAGVGAEVLYRKPNQPWAVGVDVNRVRKRDFDQHFGLQDYEVTTGNVSVYWDTPWNNVDMKLSAGQYLAGDKGVTLDLSRQFDNGIKMGGWLTKTDVSSEEFGEGSMDKGIYVSIPFDTLFRNWSSDTATLIYQPLIRDGGAKLNRRNQLIDLTEPLDNSAFDIKNPHQ